MSEHKNISEDNDPVRKKLQSLPKIKAPWYFEAKLQQRIRGGNEKGNWFTAKPLPAFALSAGVFLFVCVAGYYTLGVSSNPEEQVLLPDSGEAPNSIHHDVIVEPEKNVLPSEQPVNSPSREAGPNVPNSDVTIESGVSTENTEKSNEAQNQNRFNAAPQSQQSESNTGGEPALGLKLKSGTTYKTNLEQLDSLARRSRDSVKAKRDSLSNMR